MHQIPDRFVARFELKQDFVDLMSGRGYNASPADSSGAWILMHPRRRLVLKVGDDEPTAQFAAFMTAAVWRPELPRVLATTALSAAFTIIVMERLDMFPDAQRYDAWLCDEYNSSRGAPETDLFGVVGILTRLADEAKKHSVYLDVQGKNVLLRRGTSQLVFFDPFS